ncbi:MAG TPA: hypothetical protein VMU93_05860 [Caulobacteraceae bacterium]|nr:hypothetical protein [Caulobacteraceae bacterium]
MRLVDHRDRLAEPRRDLHRQLEAQVHAARADVEQDIARRRHRTVMAVDFAEGVQLLRSRRSVRNQLRSQARFHRQIREIKLFREAMKHLVCSRPAGAGRARPFHPRSRGRMKGFPPHPCNGEVALGAAAPGGGGGLRAMTPCAPEIGRDAQPVQCTVAGNRTVNVVPGSSDPETSIWPASCRTKIAT